MSIQVKRVPVSLDDRAEGEVGPEPKQTAWVGWWGSRELLAGPDSREASGSPTSLKYAKII